MASDRISKWEKARAARMKRTVPMPLVKKGCCRWCCGRLSGRRTSWHPECLEQYYLHTALWAQRPYVEDRDGKRCHQCGSSPIRCLNGGSCAEMVISQDGSVGWIHYEAVSFPSALQLDHEVPIWALSVLPRADRIPFFGPSNLRLLCPACHKAKTKREAAIRSSQRRRSTNA